MKRVILIPFIVLTIILSGCTTFFNSESYSDYPVEEIEESEAIVEVYESEEEEQEEPAIIATMLSVSDEDGIFEDMPLKRTRELNNPPWQEYSIEEIMHYQGNGETVFLYSDAELLEEHILYHTQIEYGIYETRNNVGKSLAKIINLYKNEVLEYAPGKRDYFNKLMAVRSAIMNGNYEAIPDLIEEARVLRTQESE